MEAKFAQFIVGARDNLDAGVLSAGSANAALTALLSDGWTIHSMVSGGYSNNGMAVTILLTRPVVKATAK